MEVISQKEKGNYQIFEFFQTSVGFLDKDRHLGLERLQMLRGALIRYLLQSGSETMTSSNC